MSNDRQMMRFQRPQQLAPRTDKPKVAKIQKAASAAIEHQNMTALIGANGARMVAELSVYGVGVFEGVASTCLARLRESADDAEKYAIMQEFTYQMMEMTGGRIKDILQTASVGIESEVAKYAGYQAPETTIWEKLFGD